MNREIKFRGKRPNSGKWIYGYLFQDGIHSYILSERFNAPECSCEVLPETVGMSLCGNDKHGNELFQGDRVVVIDRNHAEGVITWSDEHLAFLVEIKGVKFHLKHKELSDLIKVGNIHDQKPTDQ